MDENQDLSLFLRFFSRLVRLPTSLRVPPKNKSSASTTFPTALFQGESELVALCRWHVSKGWRMQRQVLGLTPSPGVMLRPGYTNWQVRLQLIITFIIKSFRFCSSLKWHYQNWPSLKLNLKQYWQHTIKLIRWKTYLEVCVTNKEWLAWLIAFSFCKLNCNWSKIFQNLIIKYCIMYIYYHYYYYCNHQFIKEFTTIYSILG